MVQFCVCVFKPYLPVFFLFFFSKGYKKRGKRECNPDNMRECLCCKWGEVDDPPEGWIEKPITMKIFLHVSALDGGAIPLNAADARKRILSMASDRLEKGLCPGVVAWCEKCERVTPLVCRGWSDAGEAILDMLEEARRFDVMYRVERSGGRHTATKEGGKNFTKERTRKDVGKDAGNDAGKEAGKEDQPGGEGLRGEPQVGEDGRGGGQRVRGAGPAAGPPCHPAEPAAG